MRTRLLILMAAIAVIASGCFRANFTVDVNDDGSGTVSGLVAFNPDALGDLAEAFGDDTGGVGDEDLCAQLDAESGIDTDGFEDVRPYNEDGFCGTEFSGTFAPGEFSSAASGLSDGGDATLRQEPDGGWFFEIPFDDSDVSTEGLPPGFEDIFDGAEYVVRVRLPGRQVEHNGEIDPEGFVVWDIDLTNPPSTLFLRTEPGERLTGTASVGGDDGGGSGLTVILIVVAVLAALGLAAWFLMRNRGGNDDAPASGVAATVPGAPTAPPVDPTAPATAATPPENTWDTQTTTPAQPAEPAAPAAPAAATPADAPDVVASPTPEQATGAPVWDPARRKYVQWDPNGSRWLVFDDATQSWGPEA